VVKKIQFLSLVACQVRSSGFSFSLHEDILWRQLKAESRTQIFTGTVENYVEIKFFDMDKVLL
jgi:extradiol dioxygenase family protein